MCERAFLRIRGVREQHNFLTIFARHREIETDRNVMRHICKTSNTIVVAEHLAAAAFAAIGVFGSLVRHPIYSLFAVYRIDRY